MIENEKTLEHASWAGNEFRIHHENDVGYYLLVFNAAGECTHDFLQDTLQLAKESAQEEFGVPLSSWNTK